MSLVIAGYAYELPRGSAVSIAEVIEHLNGQTDRGPVTRFFARGDVVSYDLRPRSCMARCKGYTYIQDAPEAQRSQRDPEAQNG